MKVLSKSFVFMVMLAALTSCASIVSHSSWPLNIVTSPEGAKVEITNRSGFVVYNGLTPATLSLKSGSDFFTKESYSIKLSMAGYQDRIIPLECKINGWYFGNIFFGGLIGILVVDPATGAMYKLERSYVYEAFDKANTDVKVSSLEIMDIKDVPANMKDKLVALK